MPAHIYLRVGRFGDASASNRSAIKADEAYLANGAVAGNMMYEVGYVAHNIHFLAASAAMEGRRADALQAADELRGRLHRDMLRDPSMGGMVQHMALTPMFTRLRFAQWVDVLAEPAPADDLPYMKAVWHAGRGMAHAGSNHLADARRELAAVAELKKDESLKTLNISSVNTAFSIVAIAHDLLAGEIAVKERLADAGAHLFASAVALEDALVYMEPPDWPIPARELQGVALLEIGRPRDAEAAFRQDLRKFPDNGWALSGLTASLERQGRTAEAAETNARLRERMQRADTMLVAARPAHQY